MKDSHACQMEDMILELEIGVRVEDGWSSLSGLEPIAYIGLYWLLVDFPPPCKEDRLTKSLKKKINGLVLNATLLGVTTRGYCYSKELLLPLRCYSLISASLRESFDTAV